MIGHYDRIINVKLRERIDFGDLSLDSDSEFRQLDSCGILRAIRPSQEAREIRAFGSFADGDHIATRAFVVVEFSSPAIVGLQLFEIFRIIHGCRIYGYRDSCDPKIALANL